MRQDRIHRVVSDDGTTIAGRVHGSGPPLVLLHGGLGDGEASFRFMLPFLVDHFTCFTPSTRGRGLSGDGADHSRERHFGDIATFIESIGEPSYLFGHSMGAVFGLGGAAMAPSTVRGLVLYEAGIPVPGWQVNAATQPRLLSAMTEGRTTDALKIVVSEMLGLHDDEQRFLLTSPALETALRNLPIGARDSKALDRPIDDIAFERLTMPVLLMGGSRSGAHFKQATNLLAAALPHARLVEIPGAGHMGPAMNADAVAEEVIRFGRPSPPRRDVTTAAPTTS